MSIRKRPVTMRWNAEAKKPSVALYIRWYLGPDGVTDTDYSYRIWKMFSGAIREKNPKAKVGSYDYFRSMMYILRRLGFIKEVEMIVETPEQPATSPVRERRGKQDFPTIWYQLVPDDEARDNLATMNMRGQVNREIFDTHIISPSGVAVRQDPLFVAWNNPTLALYKSASRPYIPTRGVKPGVRPAISPRRGRPSKKRAVKKAERAKEVKRLKRLPAKDIALEEIKKLTMASNLTVEGGLKNDKVRRDSVGLLIKAFDLNEREVMAFVERANAETLRVAEEMSDEETLDWIRSFARDVVDIRIMMYEDGKLRASEIKTLDNNATTIIDSLASIRRLNKEAVDAAVTMGISETGIEKAEEMEKAKEERKKKRVERREKESKTKRAYEEPETEEPVKEEEED